MQRGFISPALFVVVGIVIVVGISFFAGTEYSKRVNNSQYSQEKEFVSITSSPEEEILEDRCGLVPDEGYPKIGHTLSVIEGPYWSPDCRYAVSVVEAKGLGFGPNTSQEEFERITQGINKVRGAYLYTDADKSLELIYKTIDKESIYFTEWWNRENLIFSNNSNGAVKKYQYNVIDKKLAELE